jgi:hypothetical protein
MVGLWKALGTPAVTPDLQRAVADGVLHEAAGRSVEELAQEENETLVGLLRLRA